MEKRDALRISQLVGDIMQLAFLITHYTDLNCFVHYASHVQSLRVHTTRKENYTKYLTEDELYIDDVKGGGRSAQTIIDRLTRLKMQLKKILKDKKIDFRELNYTVREEYDYHLL